MKYRLSLYFLLFIKVSYFYSQENTDLITSLNQEKNIEVQQKKIDSFFDTDYKSLQTHILANYLHEIGKWYYKTSWRKNKNPESLKNAILWTKKSLELKKSIKNINSKSLKKTIYNLGYFNSLKGNHDKSVKAYLELVDFGDQDQKTLNAYEQMGKIYNLTGDFDKALICFDKLISIYKTKDSNPKKLIKLYLKKSNTYSLMGYNKFSSEIIFNLEKVDSILKKLKIKDDELYNQSNQIKGNLLLKTGKYEEAIKYHKMVIDEMDQKDSTNLAITYNSLAVSKFRLKEFDKALQFLQKSISYDSSYTSPYENIGDVFLEQKKFEKALSNYQKAITNSYSSTKPIKLNYKMLPNINEIEFAIDKIKLLNHLITKANAWVKYYEHDNNKNHLQQALKTFELADQLVDVIRFQSTEYQSKLFWRENGSSLYLQATKVCHLLNQPKKAFYFMEKNKALLLLEDITNERAKEITNIPDNIAQREFELKQAIFLTENEIQKQINSPRDTLEILKTKLYENKHEYEKFVDSLDIVFPDYAKFKKKVQIIPYDVYKTKYITNDELVLHYMLNENEGYGLLTFKDVSKFFPLKNSEQLKKDMVSLSKMLGSEITDQNTFLKTSNRIFHNLIPDDVYQAIKGKKLTIIPDYTLQHIPFETLIVNPKDIHYLIEDVEIRYVYSMSHLDQNNQIKRTAKKDFIGFAPITFTDKKLSTLFNSKEEVTEISKLFSGNTFLNAKASKNNFLAHLNDYKILHLSTHADVSENENSWIAFHDVKVFLKEIYAIKTQSELVMLSACNTSLGDLKPGEGVMSLARGFFHSGAKSVVSSLWSITGKASKTITVDFYKELDQGHTKSTALHNAKLNFIKKNKENKNSPNLWGALILIGNNDAMMSNTIFDNRTLLISAFGFLVLCALFFFFIRKQFY